MHILFAHATITPTAHASSVFLSSCSINLLAFYHKCHSVIGYATIYFNKSVSMEELSADSNAPQKFDVLETKQIICPRSKASRANMLVLRTPKPK